MYQDEAVATVQAWQDAANRGDVERLLRLSHPDIELVGPRGGGRGHQLLRDWLGRAGLRLATLRVFARGAVVVVAQRGEWRSPETGALVGEADVVSAFHVSDRRVTRLARHDNLDVALNDAGLDYSDEITHLG